MGSSEFAEFYELNRDRCLSAVAIAVRDRMLAEDLVAEGFARAFARWPKLSKHPDPLAWVIRTALNVNVSRWRRRRGEISSGEILESQGATTEIPAPLDDTVATALASLPLRQRQVIALRIFLDMDIAGCAAVLGIAEGTVNTHLQRATAALKAMLAPMEQLLATAALEAMR